jgi:hypothetical protein
MFYEQLKENYGSFGVTIIVGEINWGKSKSIELTIAQIRNPDTRSILRSSSTVNTSPCKFQLDSGVDCHVSIKVLFISKAYKLSL